MDLDVPGSRHFITGPTSGSPLTNNLATAADSGPLARDYYVNYYVRAEFRFANANLSSVDWSGARGFEPEASRSRTVLVECPRVSCGLLACPSELHCGRRGFLL